METAASFVLCFLSFQLVGGQEISFGGINLNSCTPTGGGTGSCELSTDCPDPGPDPKICGRRHSSDVICCPDVVDVNVKGRLVTAPSTSFVCGVRHVPIDNGDFAFFRKKRALLAQGIPKHILEKVPDAEVAVVGGERSSPNTWPWMALLGMDRGFTKSWFCDGVLINEQWILTAAHCLTEFHGSIIVRLGEDDHSVIFNNNRQDFKAIETIISPLYNLDEGYHDLGLIKLNRKAVLTSFVKPVCLPWGEKATDSVIDKRVTLTGWGTEEFGGRASTGLREAIVTIFDPSVCHESYSELLSFNREFPEGMNEENMICAGDPDGGVDACQGDSGGPIVEELSARFPGGSAVYTLVGIVSKGHGCGLEDFPGLYAPVATQLAWIKKIAFP